MLSPVRNGPFTESVGAKLPNRQKAVLESNQKIGLTKEKQVNGLKITEVSMETGHEHPVSRINFFILLQP